MGELLFSMRELWVLCRNHLRTQGLRDIHVSELPCHCCKYLYMTACAVRLPEGVQNQRFQNNSNFLLLKAWQALSHAYAFGYPSSSSVMRVKYGLNSLTNYNTINRILANITKKCVHLLLLTFVSCLVGEISAHDQVLAFGGSDRHSD